MKLARLTTMTSAAVLAAVLMTHAQAIDPFVGTLEVEHSEEQVLPRACAEKHHVYL